MTQPVATQSAGDGPVAPSNQVSIGLKNDQILQRYLMRRIHREAEFKVVEMDGNVQIGFITGLDDKCLQMSTSPEHAADEPRSVLLFWPLRRIEETHRKVGDFEHEHRTKIRAYSHALRAQCERSILNEAKPPTVTG